MKNLVDELFPGQEFDRLQSGTSAPAGQQKEAALPEAASQRAKRKTMDIPYVEADSAPSASHEPEGAITPLPGQSDAESYA